MLVADRLLLPEGRITLSFIVATREKMFVQCKHVWSLRLSLYDRIGAKDALDVDLIVPPCSGNEDDDLLSAVRT